MCVLFGGLAACVCVVCLAVLSACVPACVSVHVACLFCVLSVFSAFVPLLLLLLLRRCLCVFVTISFLVNRRYMEMELILPLELKA